MKLTFENNGTTTLMGIVTNKTLRAAIKRSRRNCYHAGDNIIARSTTCRSLHLVRAGMAKISLYGKNGHEKILAVAGPGTFIGAMFGCQGAAHDTTVTALTPTLCTRSWYEEDFAGLARRHPALVNILLQSLSARVCTLTTQVESLAFTASAQRVALCLLDLAQTYGQPTDKGVCIPMTLTQNDLASMASVSRVTASKTCVQLRHRGIISKEGGSLFVHDVPMLSELASG